MHPIDNPRILAIKILIRIILQKQSLSRVLSGESHLLSKVKQPELVLELCYGVLRYYPRLKYLLEQLLKKPLGEKNQDIELLILIGCYQLLYLNMPEYAVVNETVKAVSGIKKVWAKNLVNAVLRNLQRRQKELLEELDENTQARYAHPNWLMDKIMQSWPDHWETILEANNQRPPFTLRVNLSKISRDHYMQLLSSKEERVLTKSAWTDSGITITPACAVTDLPQFSEGYVSVQDNASQMAANLLDLKPELRVLDVCAAPGGKTCHMLEYEPQLERVIATEIDPKRANQIVENAQRLQISDKIQIRVSDANDLNQWWDKEPFDRVLLDAPCSGIGVIRRHADIKLLREPEDIEKLAQTQLQLLKTIWQTLKPGGVLLYSTCSILLMETTDVIQSFLNIQADAMNVPIEADWGIAAKQGRFILPGMDNMDGFFYAKLRKK